MADMHWKNATNHLKKVFCPNIFVGAGFQILNIREYAFGLKPGSALILNPNPFFEMACIIKLLEDSDSAMHYSDYSSQDRRR